jgi:hypothetical protein
MCGVRFVGYFLANKPDLRLPLFYTAPRPGAAWKGERDHDEDKWARKQAKRYEEKGREALESAKTLLCQMGFHQDYIETKLNVRQRSVVKDIINEVKSGLYDALVLGRRGLSRFEELFSTSTSKNLLDVQVDFPIWFCRNPKEEQRNVLLCLDGSDEAYRMVDHVGFFLAPEKNHEVHLLIINKKGDLGEKALNEIQSKASGLLTENGLPEDLIRTRVVSESNVPKTILRETDKGS